MPEIGGENPAGNTYRAPGRTFLLSKYPLENRIDFLEVIIEIEPLFQLSIRKCSRYFGIGFQQIQQAQSAIGFPYLHRVTLNKAIGIFAADTCLRQGKQNALRVNQPTHTVEFFCIRSG